MESKILKNVVQKTKQFESKIGAKNFSDLQKEIKTLFRPETQVAVVGWFELYIEKQLENRFKEFMFKIDHYYSTQYLDYLLNKSKKAILLLNTINQSAEKLYSEFETIFRTYKKVLKQENLYNKNKLFEKIKILHQNYKSQNLIKCLTAVFSATFDIFEENCEDSVLTSQKTKNEFLIKGFAKTTEKLAKLNFNYVLSKSAECFVKETISRKSKIFTEKQKFYLFEDLRILCEDKIFVFLEQISSKELGTVVRKDLILKMGYKEGLKLFFKNLPDIIKAPENTFFIKTVKKAFDIIKPIKIIKNLDFNPFDIRRFFKIGENEDTKKLFLLYLKLINLFKLLHPHSYFLAKLCSEIRTDLKKQKDLAKIVFEDFSEHIENLKSFNRKPLPNKESAECLSVECSEEDLEFEGEDDEEWNPDFEVEEEFGTLSRFPDSYRGTVVGRHFKDKLYLVVDVVGSTRDFVFGFHSFLKEKILRCDWKPNKPMLNEKDLMLFQDVRNRISDRLSRDLEVLIFDAQQSQKINSFVNRNKQKLDNFDHNSDKNPKKALFKETLNCLIASSDSWDESIFEKTELDSVKLPMKTKKIFDEYEEEYKKIKPIRHLIWKLKYGTVKLKIEMSNKKSKEITTSMLNGIVLNAINEDFEVKKRIKEWNIYELSIFLNLPKKMVEEAINFWESQKIIKRTIKKVIFSTPKKKQKIEKRLEKKFESLAKNIIEERDFFRLINVKEEQYFE